MPSALCARGAVAILGVLIALGPSPAAGAPGDECGANSATCSARGQQCVDPDTTVANDWTCQCTGSSTGSATAAPATCVWEGDCGIMSIFCSRRAESCEDPDTMSNSNAYCICPPPQRTVTQGDMVNAAVCELDECLVAAYSDVCRLASQTCNDPGKNTFGDWTCVCPATGATGVASAAACVASGECVANAPTCEASGQACSDPSAAAGDWQCTCLSPATGAAKQGGVAACVLDECTATCPTCAALKCTSKGHACRDKNTGSQSLGDWECYLDECVANGATCTAGQTCNDPNDATTSLMDWTCGCDAPATGSATGMAATCILDECTEATKAAICAKAAQRCSDPNTSPTAVNDYECQCIPPSTGDAAVASAAKCTSLGECATKGTLCTDQAQLCVPAAMGIMCICPTPSTGTPQAGGPAVCVLDECTVQCVTCADTGSGSVCTAAGQTCVDPNPSPFTLNDWYCVLDECTANAMTCTTGGQTCTDPNTKASSLNDWQCHCAGGTGSQVGALATCNEDECVANSATCGAQTCSDPDWGKAGDWTCSCAAPLTGTATAAQATCETDECVANSAVCTAAGQQCVDPNKAPTSLNDWTCTCVGTTVTPGNQAAAVCATEGECMAQAVTCRAQGQECVDPSTTTDNDWKCVCPAPATGEQVGGVATCAADECITNGNVCTSSGQTCTDPSQTTTGDWQCSCNLPQSGTATAAAATCEFDECTVSGVTCTGAGQTCVDADKTKTGDWKCQCSAPQTGSATAAAATCTLDECAITANKQTCEAAGQTCSDPDQAASKVGDWLCNCVAPATGSAASAPAHCAEVGDCIANGATCTAAGQSCNDPDMTMDGNYECVCIAPRTGKAPNAVAPCKENECDTVTVCTAAGQTCEDPDQMVDNDWLCRCPAMYTGTQTGGVATCSRDECVTNAVTCGAQQCVDPSPTTDNDWTCNCVAPLVGSATMAAAVCTLDECIDNKATCSPPHQTCSDPNTDPMSTGDWTCNCPAPITGTQGIAAPAVCGECATNAPTCTAAMQTCNDPDPLPTATGDWTCNCVAPFTGTGTAMAAVCTLDECQGNTACPAGQTCQDADMTVQNDWTCVCDAPNMGTATMGAATCVLDECASTMVCATAGQDCNDPDMQMTGDYVCSCRMPAEGMPVVGGAATCVDRGECRMNDAVCTMVGQTCNDPDPLPTATGDWTCNCAAPFTGTGTAMAAVCTLDECQGNTACPAGQTCQDADMTVQNDWTCVCDAPNMGTATMGAATCILDECASTMVCATAGQDCNDPDMQMTGDYVCSCRMPAEGMPVVGGAATCVDRGECRMNDAVCTMVGQTCNDPNPDLVSTGDWTCNCAAPFIGTGTAMAAVCTLDECQGNTACPAGQTCQDADMTVQNDWTCVCDAPNMGTATMGAATCVLDECASTMVCATAGQDCNDPDMQMTGDYVCSCRMPAEGMPVVGGAATCVDLGECRNNNVCTMAGQTCNDPNPDLVSTGDWECVCSPPQSGKATGGVATCSVDECAANAMQCPAGQTCADPDPATDNDWMCTCDAPLEGNKTGGAAICLQDECITKGTVCATAGQLCTDRDTQPTALDDWECSCIAPSTGMPATAQVATCSMVDECVANNDTCATAGQTCDDPDTSLSNNWVCVCPDAAAGSAVGMPAVCDNECNDAAKATCGATQTCQDMPGPMNWVCVCNAPSVGQASMAAAVCTDPGECATKGAVCATYGQTCQDPDTSKADDWTCDCILPAMAMGGPVVGAPALCDEVGECVMHASTCHAANQSCNDPDPMVDGDWRCECIAPDTGSGMMGAATCGSTDECAVQGGVCTAAGQTCSDPDPAATGDWVCSCVSPAAGMPVVGGVANCTDTVDECAANGNVCTLAGQDCSDPDQTATGDWQCTCRAPDTGSGVAMPATCTSAVDECETQGSACTAQGQTCLDQNQGVLGDWTCLCQGSGTGMAVGGPATCVWSGECASSFATCAREKQACLDPDTATSDDWQCICIGGNNATATGKPAICGDTPTLAPIGKLDECVANAATCEAVGQECTDPQQTYASTGDWKCRCVGSSSTEATAAAAQCQHTGSCAGGNADTCSAAGQACNSSATTDYDCFCVGSLAGSQTNGIATCRPAASLPPGAGCSYTDIDQCVGDSQCDWAHDRSICIIRYCAQREDACGLDPICEVDIQTRACVRRRCGKFTTPAECQAAQECRWEDNAGGTLPLRSLPYPLAPAYCTHEGTADDNSKLLGWLILIAVVLCLTVTCVMYLATRLRKRVARKEEHRLREEKMQQDLLSSENQLGEMRRIVGHSADMMQDMKKEVAPAPSLARARGHTGPQDADETDEEDDQSESAYATSRAGELSDQLARLRLRAAQQKIQKVQREEADEVERKKRRLEREMDQEARDRATTLWRSRNKASHALQTSIAYREAALRSRERLREQELVTEVARTQGLIEQQRRHGEGLADADDIEMLGLPQHGGSPAGSGYSAEEVNRLLAAEGASDYSDEPDAARPLVGSAGLPPAAPGVSSRQRRQKPAAQPVKVVGRGSVYSNSSAEMDSVSELLPSRRAQPAKPRSSLFRDTASSPGSPGSPGSVAPTLHTREQQRGGPDVYRNHYETLAQQLVSDKMASLTAASKGPHGSPQSGQGSPSDEWA